MTVAFVPVSFGYGTTMRCLAVATELRRRGIPAVFLAGETVQPMISHHEFPVRTIPDLRIQANPAELPAKQLFDQEDAPGFLQHQLNCLIEQLKVVDARLVVYSNSLTAALAASHLDLPSISIFAPAILRIPALSFVVPMLHSWLLFEILRRRTRLCYSVPSAFLGTRSFIPSIPPLIDWPAMLPPSLIFRRAEAEPVGALLTRSPDELPPDDLLLQELGVRRRPFVYATVGGAIFSLDLIRAVADGIRQADCAGLLSGGDAVTDEVARRLSDDRVRVVRFVPDDFRAIKSADLLIWHGGHQTMLEAVACGTPAIGLPYQLDQYPNVAGLVRNGAGLRLRPRSLSAEDLARAIRRLLVEPTFRVNVGRLRQINRDYRGAAAVADAVSVASSVPIPG